MMTGKAPKVRFKGLAETWKPYRLPEICDKYTLNIPSNLKTSSLKNMEQ